MDHTDEFSFTHTVCAHTYSPFCPTSPGSPGGKQPFSCKTLCNCLFLNSLKMLTNMPFGPGAPRSPFSEYASVSVGRYCQSWSMLLQLLELACHSKSICDFCFVFVYLSQPLSVIQSWPAAGRPSAVQHHPVLIHSRSHHVGFRPLGWFRCRNGWGWTQRSSSRCRMNLAGRWRWCQRRRTGGWSWLM